jgi:hypothetical protein
MDSFYGIKLYEDLKNMSDCLYVDLDSESSDKMLYKCSDAISKKINESLEKKVVVEGFSSNCCPDGTTKVNNHCVEVCNNCKYNDCNYGSSNIGNFFYKKPFPVDKKENNNLILDEHIFNYIVLDVPSN